MTAWLLLGALVVAVVLSAIVMSLFVGVPFAWDGRVRRSDDLLDRVATRVHAGESQHDALLDEPRRRR